MTLIAAALLLMAQPATAPPVDPQRLTAARALVDDILPPARRDAMMKAMVRPMFDGVRKTVLGSEKFAAMLSNDPRAAAIVDRFIAAQMASSEQSMSANLPALVDAMSTAYARVFTLAELTEANAFYATPAGRSFMEKAPAIMADPAVAAVQQKMMAEQMDRLPAATKQLAAELAALEQKK